MSDRTKRTLVYVVVIGFAIFSVWKARGTSAEAQEAADGARVAAQKANQNAAALTSGLIQSCRVNGNPLRRVVDDLERILRKQIQASIAQSAQLQRSGAYEQFFPGIPPQKLHALLERDRRQQLTEIARLDHAVQDVKIHVNCARQYR